MRIFLPHRLGDNIAEVIDGTILKCPSFCKSSRPKCIEFYRSLTPNTLCVCPFGFAVHYLSLNKSNVYLIGLSVEEINSKKEYNKRIGRKETIKRFGRIQYKELIEDLQEHARLEDSIQTIQNEAEEVKKTCKPPI